MKEKSIAPENYPNSYDLQAIKPIEDVLNTYLLDISWAFAFQEHSLENKKIMIRDMALLIDEKLHK